MIFQLYVIPEGHFDLKLLQLFLPKRDKYSFERIECYFYWLVILYHSKLQAFEIQVRTFIHTKTSNSSRDYFSFYDGDSNSKR